MTKKWPKNDKRISKQNDTQKKTKINQVIALNYPSLRLQKSQKTTRTSGFTCIALGFPRCKCSYINDTKTESQRPCASETTDTCWSQQSCMVEKCGEVVSKFGGDDLSLARTLAPFLRSARALTLLPQKKKFLDFCSHQQVL